MPAHYDLFRNPESEEDKKQGRTGRIHARLVNQNVIRIDRLAEEISQFSSFTSADVKGILEIFRTTMLLHFKQGEIVELKGLGTFNLSLKSIPALTAEEVTPTKVRINKVVFRCSKKLKNELFSMKFERAAESSRLKGYTEKKRKENILRYLAREYTISSTLCRGLNHCSRYLALKDLNALCREGKIACLGLRANAQYALVTAEGNE
ncbi:MAG: HU family DNA-binding protein [Spirochaetaceae bacterium]|jgi:predicted histone-like DNA-binding protein|nr:HU family DNA-binding protein [Spirochaetaceae bacterium]